MIDFLITWAYILGFVVVVASILVVTVVPLAFLLAKVTKPYQERAEEKRRSQVAANLEAMRNDPHRESRIHAERERLEWADSRSDHERCIDWREMGLDSFGVWKPN